MGGVRRGRGKKVAERADAGSVKREQRGLDDTPDLLPRSVNIAGEGTKESSRNEGRREGNGRVEG
jgi:hypothetical protein